jgi:hypothetical protein
MQYDAALPFAGDTEKAFGLAESALTGIGFRITKRTAESVELVGPRMNSSRESTLIGASRIRILDEGRQLVLEAELGGVARMSRFVTLFPMGLMFFLCVVFGVVFGVAFGPGDWIWAIAAVAGGNALLWLLLGPWMARKFRDRTTSGLDALLANMVAVGESE